MGFVNYRIVWWLGGTIIVLLVLGFAAYWHFFVSILTIDNRSAAELASVRVVMAGEQLWTGTIAAGNSETVYGVPKAEGTLDVWFEISGRRMHQGIDYVTNGAAANYKMTVAPDFKVSVERH